MSDVATTRQTLGERLAEEVLGTASDVQGVTASWTQGTGTNPTGAPQPTDTDAGVDIPD
jgi:hypothetical protein